MGIKRAPLAPYRVLDLTDESGVFCTKILASLGADVIRVEPPEGDPTRSIGPFYHDEPDPEKSLHWFTYNLNKRSVTLNIECTTGQELFKRLVKTADFLVECFRPGYLDKLGLGYAILSELNPRLVQTSITPFGSTGPYRQFKGSNLVVSAASGYLYLCGDAERPPVQCATPLAWYHTGLEATTFTMMAHWYRQRTGQGQQIDVSAQESFMSQALPDLLFWKSHGWLTQRSADGRNVAATPAQAATPAHAARPAQAARPAPRSMIKCQDGYVLFSIRPYLAEIREWLASEGMTEDLFEKEWDDVILKKLHPSPEQQHHVDDLVQAFALKHTRDELMWGGEKRGIEVAKVQNVRDVMEDTHLKERGYFVQVEHPEIKDTITYGGSPFKSDEMSWGYQRRAPFIGEHNQEIYIGELGLNKQELAVLKEGGVI